jgi:hypothetical protein
MIDDIILLAKNPREGVRRSSLEEGLGTIFGRMGTGKSSILGLGIAQFAASSAREKQEGGPGTALLVVDCKGEPFLHNLMFLLSMQYGIPLQTWALDSLLGGSYLDIVKYLLNYSINEAAEIFADVVGLAAGDIMTYGPNYWSLIGVAALIEANKLGLRKFGRRPETLEECAKLLSHKTFRHPDYLHTRNELAILSAAPKLNPPPGVEVFDIAGGIERAEFLYARAPKITAPATAVIGLRSITNQAFTYLQRQADTGRRKKCMILVDEVQVMASGNLIKDLVVLARQKGAGLFFT